MDALLLEQHLRSPMRLFPEPMMPQFSLSGDGDSMASAALLEKARQHLQMWGRSPYAEMMMSQVYQQHQQQHRPNMGALNLGLWQGQWPQLPPGFLANPSALLQHQQHQQQQQQMLSRTPPPPSTTPQQQSAPSALSITPTSSSSGSPSPSEFRSKHVASSRFSPYPLPQSHQQSHSPQSSRGSPSNH